MGLYQVIFKTYAAAVWNLRFLGWVEEGRSVPKGSREPSEVRYFNKLIGGSGRLFAAEDGWVFLAKDGWLMKVYKKLLAQGVLGPERDKLVTKHEPGSVLDLFGAE